MFFIVVGAISLALSIYSMTGRNITQGKHRPMGVRPPKTKNHTDVPGLAYMIWFFLSLVSILAGYVQLAAG